MAANMHLRRCFQAPWILCWGTGPLGSRFLFHFFFLFVCFILPFPTDRRTQKSENAIGNKRKKGYGLKPIVSEISNPISSFGSSNTHLEMIQNDDETVAQGFSPWLWPLRFALGEPDPLLALVISCCFINGHLRISIILEWRDPVRSYYPMLGPLS